MASSPLASPLEERQEHEADPDREATEMGNYDEVLRRSSVYINSSAQLPGDATPTGAYFPSTRRSLAKLWHRQVSVVVPHAACRDHFGTPIFPFARPAAPGAWTSTHCEITRLLRVCLSWPVDQFAISIQQALCDTVVQSLTYYLLHQPWSALFLDT